MKEGQQLVQGDRLLKQDNRPEEPIDRTLGLIDEDNSPQYESVRRIDGPRLSGWRDSNHLDVSMTDIKVRLPWWTSRYLGIAFRTLICLYEASQTVA